LTPDNAFHHVAISESKRPHFGFNSTNIQFPEITAGVPFAAIILSYPITGTEKVIGHLMNYHGGLTTLLWLNIKLDQYGV